MDHDPQAPDRSARAPRKPQPALQRRKAYVDPVSSSRCGPGRVSVVAQSDTGFWIMAGIGTRRTGLSQCGGRGGSPPRPARPGLRCLVGSPATPEPRDCRQENMALTPAAARERRGPFEKKGANVLLVLGASAPCQFRQRRGPVAPQRSRGRQNPRPEAALRQSSKLGRWRAFSFKPLLIAESRQNLPSVLHGQKLGFDAGGKECTSTIRFHHSPCRGNRM